METADRTLSRWIISCGITLICLAASARAADGGRVVLSMNQGWRFLRLDDPKMDADAPTKDDRLWDIVNLPHTVRLEPVNASGGRNFQGICWYTRHFQPAEAWKDHTLYLRFEGAMQVADVWLNGQKLITHFGGYQPFTIDISKGVKFGAENVIAVRLDNSDNKQVPPGKPQDKLDFTYFGGLYRDVDLLVLDHLHVTDEILANKVAGGGVVVSYPSVSESSAVVQVQADVMNEYADARKATVDEQIRDSSGAVVAAGSTDVQIAGGATTVSTAKLTVRNPQLWHPEHPSLYTLITTIKDGEKVADQLSTRIGIRTIEFTVDQGMLINSKRFISIGANRHQDHPYVGYAIPASGQYRDAKLLREAGFTSFRSHYPQDRAFFDACDELGILVIESNPGWQFGGDDLFTQRVYQNAREMIRRDRNRPSVILWEAQLNETAGYDAKHFADLMKIVHEEDPFNGCYAAGDSVEKKAGGEDWDVVYNNNKGDKPYWQREYGDSVDNWSDQQSSSRVARSWGETPMLVQAWRHAEMFDRILARDKNGAKPALCGVDIWAGVDAYRGYHHQPFLGAPYDLFRLPKFDAYFFQSQRPPDWKRPPALRLPELNDGPMVFIANHATFQSPSSVTVFSNCEEVRLSQNGKAIATEKPSKDFTGLPHPPFSFKINQLTSEGDTMFMTGIAKPGTRVGELKAEGLIGGKVVATHIVRAPGVAAKLTLEADLDGRDLTADGSDWLRVYARVCDARGTVAPYADDDITFEVTGPGEVIADAHANNNPAKAEAGIATALVRAGKSAGEITVRATAFGLAPAEIKIVSKPSTRQFVP